MNERGGFEKRLEFTGQQRGQLETRLVELDYLDKLAASDMAREVAQFISSLRSHPKKIYVLNVALGDSDCWGTNNNGEYFFGRRRFRDFPQIIARFPQLAKYEYGGLLTDHPRYGAKTFLINPAHFFDHHRNKDIARAYGRCVFQHYNPVMRRVELVFELWPDKMHEFGSADVLQRLENGLPIPSSMGCRVPWDVCSRCGNIARFKYEYCNCLKHFINRVMPDGEKVGALNFLASYHDMSRVNSNADRSCYVLQKVAKDKRRADEKKKKTKRTGDKCADIDKQVTGVARMIEVVRTDPPLDLNQLRQLRKQASTDVIFDASTKSAFVFKPEEFQYLLLEDAVPGLGEKYAQQGVCFPFVQKVAELSLGDSRGRGYLLAEFLPQRWLSDDALARRLFRKTASDDKTYEKTSVLSATSALYNGYVCGIMNHVLLRGPDTELVKRAAFNGKKPLKVITPLNLGAGALAYMMASMLQSVERKEDQERAAKSLLTDPRVAGILTAVGMAALRRKMG